MSSLTAMSVRRKWTLGATALFLVALVAVVFIATGDVGSNTASTPPVDRLSPTAAETSSPSNPGSLTSAKQSDLDQSIGRMRDVVPVAASASPQPHSECRSPSST